MKHELIPILQIIGHTCDLENSLIFSYQNRFKDMMVAEFLHEALEDRHHMANHGKMPNKTWEVILVSFDETAGVAMFDLKCRKPKWPDESFLYGCEIGVIAKQKKPR